MQAAYCPLATGLVERTDNWDPGFRSETRRFGDPRFLVVWPWPRNIQWKLKRFWHGLMSIGGPPDMTSSSEGGAEKADVVG